MSWRFRWLFIWIFRESCGFAVRRPRTGWEGIVLPGFIFQISYGRDFWTLRPKYGITIEYTRPAPDEWSR